MGSEFHQLTAFIPSYDFVTEEYKEKMATVTEFDFLLNSVPIDPTNMFSLDLNNLLEKVLNNDYYSTGTSARKFASILFSAPDSLVSFKNVDLNGIQMLDEIQGIIEKSSDQDMLLDFLKVTFPMFSRVPIYSITNIKYEDFMGLVGKKLPESQFTKALVITHLCAVLLKTFRDPSNFDHYSNIIKIKDDLRQFYEGEYYDIIVPALFTLVAKTFIYILSAIHKVNDNHGRQLHACVSCMAILTEIASMYPQAFENLPIRTVLRFLNDDRNNAHLFPTYEFVLQYPEMASRQMIAENIEALISTFDLFASMTDKPNQKIIAGVLIQVIRQGLIYSRAAACSLLNLSKFSRYSKPWKIFCKMYKTETESDAHAIIVALSQNNFSNELTELMRKFPKCEFPSKYKDELNILEHLNHPNCYQRTNFLELIRIVDGLNSLSTPDFYITIRNSQFPQFITNYVTTIIRSGLHLLEFRLAVPFSHFLTSFLKLLFRFSKKTKAEKSLTPEIHLVLILYDAFLSLAPYIMDEDAQEISIIESQVFLARKEFAKVLLPYGSKFLVDGFIVVRYEHATLLPAMLALTADIFSLQPFNFIFIQGFIAVYKYFFPHILESESLIMQKINYIFMLRLYQNISVSYLGELTKTILDKFSYYFDQRDKTSRAANICIRILYLLSRFSTKPEIKNALIWDKQYKKLVDASIRCIKDDVARNHIQIFTYSCDILINFASPSLTLNQEFSYEFRSTTETLKEKHFSALSTILFQILRFPVSYPEEIMVPAIRLTRYLCESIYFVKKLQEMNFQIPISKLLNSEMANSDLFVSITMELALAVAKIDTQIGRQVINYNEDKQLLKNERLRVHDATYQYLEELKKVNSISSIRSLKSIQKCFFNRERWSGEKTESRNDPFPPVLNNYSIIQGLKDTYNSYFKLDYKKKAEVFT